MPSDSYPGSEGIFVYAIVTFYPVKSIMTFYRHFVVTILLIDSPLDFLQMPVEKVFDQVHGIKRSYQKR